METISRPDFKNLLESARENILERSIEVFKSDSYEAHVFGSVARDDADAYSDLDVWFTIEDIRYARVFQDRVGYYEKLGTIVHSCEAPQNAPIGGVHTALILETEKGCLTMVDVYLCPLSTSFITDDAKKLFGEDLPAGQIGFNSQKIQISEDYRIDFFTCFLFNTIKKIARGKQDPLGDVLHQYDNLREKYDIPVPEITLEGQNLDSLETIINNTCEFANERQKEALKKIGEFGRKVLA